MSMQTNVHGEFEVRGALWEKTPSFAAPYVSLTVSTNEGREEVTFYPRSETDLRKLSEEALRLADLLEKMKGAQSLGMVAP